MAETVDLWRRRVMSSGARPFLAADVGGTHARVGLVQGSRDGQIRVLAYRKYACGDFSGLSAILRDFLATQAKVPVQQCALACAGYVLDDEVVNYNLPWKLSLSELRRELGVSQLALINDFEAVAHAARFINVEKTQLLAGPERAAGPLIMVGPGTGLGSAVCIPRKGDELVLATEAGQTNLAPGTAAERDVLAHLAGADSYVAHERVLCGPGLVTLYGVLAEMRAAPAALETPEAITAAALAQSDAIAEETLHMFCALLGSFVGNLVLLYGARGGVYLTGGILPGMRDFLMCSRFVERFLDKGRMRAYLERVPVRLVEHGQLGVIGAANWYLENHMQQSADKGGRPRYLRGLSG
ncbi:MAG: glucokinase [Gammaproteobacteria bacterium]